MPYYSAYNWGTYNVTIPAYSTNVRLTVGAAGGGGSASDTWNWPQGGNGRVGDFRLAVRSYDYNLTIYLGERGQNGVGPHNPGGSGGRSPVAAGGQGHRSGGGGGGASAVYDGGLNRYVITVGGGGGAGRFANDTGMSSSGFYSAGRGIGGGRTTGSWGHRNGGNAPAGHRGGGGGGADSGGAGSWGGATTTNGYAGIGGNSRMFTGGNYYDWTTNSGYGNAGDGYYVLAFDYAPPSIQYFTLEPQQILQGGNTVMSWSSIGNVSTTLIDPYGSNLNKQDSVTISPTQDTAYQLVVTGPGGVVSQTRTIDVLIPPDVQLSTTNATISRGNTVVINYAVTGDVSTVQVNQGIGALNISGSSFTVAPTVTTTYTMVASHPLAGQDSDQITITVLQPPSVSLTGPTSVEYGDDVLLDATSENTTTSLQLLAKYNYQNAPGTNYELVHEFTASNQLTSQQTYSVPYTDQGPESIEYKLYGIGSDGQTAEDIFIVSVNIDRTPDTIDIPSSLDKLIDQDPIITPDDEVVSTVLTVDDVDIPVEIKSDYPIKVEIDNDGVYRDMRQIT